MKTFKIRLRLIAAIGSLALAAVAQQTSSMASSAPSSPNGAGVPQLVNYSGVLTDINGKALAAVVGVTFALYQDAEGGAPLWAETQNIQPTKSGHYTVMLGSTSSTGLLQDVFVSGEARWLGVQVEGQAEAPRVLLVAVPYALKAGDAETIGGLPASAFVLANGSAGTASSTKSATAAISAAAPKNSAPPANPAVTGKGTVSHVPLWDTTSDIVDSLIFQKSSNIGIGTTAPAATLDVIGKTDVRDTLTLFPKSTDNTLAVSGTAFNISSLGKVTFVSGQTFPGAGTITGVATAAGSGLSGGGTSGTLSLKVPAAGITNAMLADSKVTLNASTAGGLTVPGAMTLGSTYTIGLKTCTANQVLQFIGTAWACASAGTGTVTSVGSGSGLTGGPITGSGALSIATGGVSNAMLTHSSLTISPGADLTGGGTVALGGSTSLSLDTTKVPLLAAANTFNANQTVNGTVTASSFSGNGSALTNVTATNSSELGGLGSSAYAQLAAANTFSTDQTVNGMLKAVSSDFAIEALTSSDASPAVYGSGNAFGVEGIASGAGVIGYTNSSTGIGTEGYSFPTVGNTMGVFGVSNSTSGYGVYGLSPYAGVYGVTSALSGYTVGPVSVWGDTGGPSSQNVAVAGTAGDNIAGVFINASTFNSTIYAQNLAGTNANEIFYGYVSTTGAPAIIGDPECGVGFIALQLGGSGMSGCSNYTLTGGSSGDTFVNAVSGAAVHLRVNNVDQLVSTSGNTDILGTLTKPAGSFKIDHPLDPANKYLYHSFVESPDMMNIYNGNATTDASGEAAVQLPEWFETLNRDFRYQLTVIGQFAQAIVAGKVANHQFVIKTDKPNVEVSWQVTGIRQDAFANAHRIQVEAEKAPADRGHYLYPELVGAPQTARIGYMAPAPGGEQVVHRRPVIQKRSDSSPQALPGIPLPSRVPAAPKLAPISHPPAPVGKLAVNQK